MQNLVKKNEIIRLEITAISNEGDGIGRHEGLAVFVPLTAIGDVIEAKVVKVMKNHAFGIIEKIISPSAQRVENSCPVYRRCGGCSLRHIDYASELETKANWVTENLRRIGGVDFDDATIEVNPPLPSPISERYRNKAQYPVRRVGGKIQVGFFAKRSHELIPADDCLLQPVFFSDIIRIVVEFCEKYTIEPYDEVAHSGLLRHVFIRYAEATGEAALCLVINGAKLPNCDKLVEMLQTTCPNVKTVVANENRTKSNVIFGEKTTVISGDGYITDILCGIRVRLSAQSFYQVNRQAAEQLYKVALEYASPSKNDVLLDLYCGTGTIGLSMAHDVREVIGVEVVASAISDAKVNAIENGITNARFILGDATIATEKLKSEGIRPDIIVLDPPRKGCDDNLPALIAELAPKKLVYISCNSATLARDVARLLPLGYKLEKVRAVDLFPRTAHVECVVLMSRV